MLKKTIKYIDHDGNERTEDFYFNINKVELGEMELSASGGLTKHIQKMIVEVDKSRMLALVKDFILLAYGEKSLDGKYFVKSKEISKAFSETNAFVELFMELASSAEAMTLFVNGIVPQVN